MLSNRCEKIHEQLEAILRIYCLRSQFFTDVTLKFADSEHSPTELGLRINNRRDSNEIDPFRSQPPHTPRPRPI